jgi:hypothetical protein
MLTYRIYCIKGSATLKSIVYLARISLRSWLFPCSSYTPVSYQVQELLCLKLQYALKILALLPDRLLEQALSLVRYLPSSVIR